MRMDDFQVQEEMKEAIGISGLFSRKKAVENVVSYFEKNGEGKSLERYARKMMERPEYQFLEEVHVGNGFANPTVQDVLEQSYGITLDSSSRLRVNGEKIAVVYDKSIIPLKGKKEELKDTLEKIVELRKEAGYGRKGPFTRALTQLDNIPEFDPQEERRRLEEEKEYKKLEIQQKVLEEIPHVNVQKTRRLGFIPSTNVTLNPSYDEFFHNHLGEYSTKEIHQSLRDLEKDAQGSVKEKVKALRTEHQKRDIYGGHHFTNGPLTAILIGISIAAPLALGGYALYQHFNNGNGSNNHNPPPTPTTKENFLNFAAANNITRTSAENFYGNYTTHVNDVYPKNPSLLPSEVKLFSEDPVTYAELQRNISQDPRVTVDRSELLSKSSQQFLDLGLHGNVNVLQPGTNEYKSQPLTNHTIQAVSNATLASYQRNLPTLSKDSYFNLGNATQLNPEIGDFSKIVLTGKDGNQVDLWKDTNKVDLSYYTLAMDLSQSPYVLHKPESFEFFNGLLRQHNYVLDTLSLNPSNQTIRSTYVRPDIDYYYQYLPTKKIVANGTEITFPLLPLLNGTKMKEWFPEKTDRAVIYASQYPIQLACFNAKTGEMNQEPHIYKPQTLLDNMNLVWNEGKWGNFTGKLVDRIAQSYIDKNLTSYDPFSYPLSTGWSDHDWARRNYEAKLVDFVNIYPEMSETISKFVKDYDPKLASNPLMDLSHRFISGLALYDGAQINEPHQYAPERTSLYTKALGSSEITICAKHPSHGYVFETAATPTPQYLVNQLPSTARYGPGRTICRFTASDDSIGLMIELPNGDILWI